MKSHFKYRLAASIVLGCLLVLSGCGGGGGSEGGGTGTQTPPPQNLTITSPQQLPGTLQNAQYSYTLQAINGTGALTWSIAPISSTASFVDGLSIDPSTGVLSGTALFGGVSAFTATVKDSASPAHTATKDFTISAAFPLTAPAPQTFTVGQYRDSFAASLGVNGGVHPLSFRVTSGVLPQGIKLDRQIGELTGGPVTVGDFPIVVTVQDSYSPAEVVTAQIDIKVNPIGLSIAQSLPRHYLLNRPFSGRIVATGGTPPYTFTLTDGSLPPGMGPIDPHTGQLNGTPTALFSELFTVTVKDSASVPNTASGNYEMTVANPLGRNDSVSTATLIDNGQFSATISPYIDPPETAVPGDNDYYKIISVSGATVHVETFAMRGFYVNSLDTVIELVDGNNNRLTTCRQPGDTSTNFSSPCLNDDISASPHVQDSALDIKVPGTASTPTTFYVHVLDFRGDARPDMPYQLSVSGVTDPLAITNPYLIPASRGIAYSQQLNSQNGTGTVAYTLIGGNLPPGVNLASSGVLSGSPTADGTYTPTFKATDSSTPPQTVTKQFTIKVVEPITITSSAVWPDACLNQPYSFAIQTSGGLPPFTWGFSSTTWMGISFDQSTGVFSGSSNVKGTFNGTVFIRDSTFRGVLQDVTVTVKDCP